MSLECIWCQDYKPCMEAINGPIVLQQIRMPSYRPTFKPFKFCPWCGHELHAVEPKPQAVSGNAT